MEVKQPKTFEEQLEILKGRGCKVENEEEALRILKSINYYRLTAYFIPFKKTEDEYYEGTEFNNIYQIYIFDQKLRSLLFPVIEEIELLLRTRLSYFFSHKYGPLGYLDASNFSAEHDSAKLAGHIKGMINNNKSKPFVAHHLTNRDGNFPLWVLVELMSFGELSIFYKDMTLADKKAFVNEVFGQRHNNMDSWLHCLSTLRNYCAHYSRIYNTTFAPQPGTPKEFPHKLGKRIFDYILVIKFLYTEKERWRNEFVPALETLINSYSDYIDMDCIGFVENWKDLLLY